MSGLLCKQMKRQLMMLYCGHLRDRGLTRGLGDKFWRVEDSKTIFGFVQAMMIFQLRSRTTDFAYSRVTTFEHISVGL